MKKNRFKVTFTKIDIDNWVFTIYNGTKNNITKAGDLVLNIHNYKFNPEKSIMFNMPTELCNKKFEYHGEVYLPKVILQKDEFSSNLMRAIDENHIKHDREYYFDSTNKTIEFTKTETVRCKN